MRNPVAQEPAVFAGTLRCGYCRAEYPVVSEVLQFAAKANSDCCIVCPPPSECYRRWQTDRASWAASRDLELARAVARLERGQEPPIPEWMERDPVAQERLRAARKRYQEGGNQEDPLA